MSLLKVMEIFVETGISVSLSLGITFVILGGSGVTVSRSMYSTQSLVLPEVSVYFTLKLYLDVRSRLLLWIPRWQQQTG